MSDSGFYPAGIHAATADRLPFAIRLKSIRSRLQCPFGVLWPAIAQLTASAMRKTVTTSDSDLVNNVAEPFAAYCLLAGLVSFALLRC